MSSIYISADMRNKGIGRILFLAAKEWTKQKGAKKLYISAHSAIESQAFYKSMGCVDLFVLTIPIYVPDTNILNQNIDLFIHSSILQSLFPVDY